MKNLINIFDNCKNEFSYIWKVSAFLIMVSLVFYFFNTGVFIENLSLSLFAISSTYFIFFVPLRRSFYNSIHSIALVLYAFFSLFLVLYQPEAFIISMLTILIMQLANRYKPPTQIFTWILQLLTFFATWFIEILILIIVQGSKIKDNDFSKIAVLSKKIFFYALIPALLSFVFLMIFSNASPEINQFVDCTLETINSILNIDYSDVLTWLFILAISVAIYKCLIPSKITLKFKLETNTFDNEIAKKTFTISLVCLNLVFLLLNLLNIKYYFFDGGLPKNQTLSSFAMQSCVSMSWGCFFAGIFILLSFLTGLENKRIKELLYVWILQNFIIILTAICRMFNYVSAYGFSLSRINGLILILFLTVCLALCFVKMLRNKPLSFLNNAVIYTSIIFLTANILFDSKSFCAKYNLQTQENPDIEYIARSLLPEALPVVIEYMKTDKGKARLAENEVCLSYINKHINSIKSLLLKSRTNPTPSSLNGLKRKLLSDKVKNFDFVIEATSKNCF